MLSQDLLKELFDYKSGNLIWKRKRSNNIRDNKIAGCLNKLGYIVININKKLYYAHRLVYVWHFGDIKDNLSIDHINRDRSDNRIDNLRLVTHQENMFNVESKGYHFCKAKNKFKANIMFNGKVKYLGLFNTELEAKEAYLNAKEKVHTFNNSCDESIMKVRTPKGYAWSKSKKKYRVDIMMFGKRKYIGYFTNEDDAQNAYNEAKKLYDVMKEMYK